jgi:hypothetical protein
MTLVVVVIPYGQMITSFLDTNTTNNSNIDFWTNFYGRVKCVSSRLQAFHLQTMVHQRFQPIPEDDHCQEPGPLYQAFTIFFIQSFQSQPSPLIGSKQR